jgi:superfamily I DNA and/or RNA helicase
MIRPNRINVALSRAMDRLVIIGARTRWPVDGPMHRVAQAFERELSLNSARLVDVSRLDKRNASPPPSRPQGPKGGRHLRGRKR